MWKTPRCLSISPPCTLPYDYDGAHHDVVRRTKLSAQSVMNGGTSITLIPLGQGGKLSAYPPETLDMGGWEKEY